MRAIVPGRVPRPCSSPRFRCSERVGRTATTLRARPRRRATHSDGDKSVHSTYQGANSRPVQGRSAIAGPYKVTLVEQGGSGGRQLRLAIATAR